ncbi:MAG TPA: threonine/serine exporter family protein [Candidatus Merdenecus merdavium]|nr:threonine/serine exporter family protein [Candidatus Merdenecus merdavium]
MVFQVVGAFFAVFGFSIYLDVPKKYLRYCGYIGAIGWFVYLMAVKKMNVLMATFLATATIAFISHICARIFKAPVTVFLIAGIITLVPGAGMYRTVSQILLGNRSLAMEYLQETIQIAGMIALAIFIIDAIFRMIQAKKWKEKLPVKHK